MNDSCLRIMETTTTQLFQSGVQQCCVLVGVLAGWLAGWLVVCVYVARTRPQMLPFPVFLCSYKSGDILFTFVSSSSTAALPPLSIIYFLHTINRFLLLTKLWSGTAAPTNSPLLSFSRRKIGGKAACVWVYSFHSTPIKLAGRQISQIQS